MNLSDFANETLDEFEGASYNITSDMILPLSRSSIIGLSANASNYIITIPNSVSDGTKLVLGNCGNKNIKIKTNNNMYIIEKDMVINFVKKVSDEWMAIKDSNLSNIVYDIPTLQAFLTMYPSSVGRGKRVKIDKNIYSEINPFDSIYELYDINPTTYAKTILATYTDFATYSPDDIFYVGENLVLGCRIVKSTTYEVHCSFGIIDNSTKIITFQPELSLYFKNNYPTYRSLCDGSVMNIGVSDIPDNSFMVQDVINLADSDKFLLCCYDSGIRFYLMEIDLIGNSWLTHSYGYTGSETDITLNSGVLNKSCYPDSPSFPKVEFSIDDDYYDNYKLKLSDTEYIYTHQQKIYYLEVDNSSIVNNFIQTIDYDAVSPSTWTNDGRSYLSHIYKISQLSDDLYLIFSKSGLGVQIDPAQDQLLPRRKYFTLSIYKISSPTNIQHILRVDDDFYDDYVNLFDVQSNNNYNFFEKDKLIDVLSYDEITQKLLIYFITPEQYVYSGFGSYSYNPSYPEFIYVGEVDLGNPLNIVSEIDSVDISTHQLNSKEYHMFDDINSELCDNYKIKLFFDKTSQQDISIIDIYKG